MQPSVDPSQIQFFGIALLITYTIIYLFCRSLVRALSYVDQENRAIPSGIIWLLLVPVINYFVNFLVVLGLSKSISRELERRNFEKEANPTLLPGILFSSASLIIAIILIFDSVGFHLPKALMPLFGVIAFSQIFFFVQYWMKIIWYKKILESDEQESDDVHEQDEE